MEKENVLEIETQEVFDKVAIRIKYQNFEVLKRGEFYDRETGVESVWTPEYIKDDNKLYIQGKENDKDSKILLVDKEDLKNILEIVNKINEKYWIPKRCEPQLKENFFIIERVRTEVSFKWVVTDLIYKNDHWIDFYAINNGNCFKTYEEAEKVVLKLEELEKNFWAKVRAGEIGGENVER